MTGLYSTCRSVSTAAALLLALLSTAPISATQDFEWTGRIQSGQTIEIKGIIGDIQATAVSGTQARVVAEKYEGRNGDAEDVQIDVIEHDDGVTICAVYPGKPSERPNECRSGGRGRHGTHENDTEVNFTVEVPAGVLFVGRTVTGDVDARSLDGDIEAYTVTGDIDVATAGYAKATTVTGHIHASMGSTDWNGSLEISTVTGRIVVELPDGAGADVSAKTVTGGITTDFPLRVQGRFMSKRVNGTIGGGGRALSLETVTGSIRLRRSEE